MAAEDFLALLATTPTGADQNPARHASPFPLSSILEIVPGYATAVLAVRGWSELVPPVVRSISGAHSDPPPRIRSSASPGYIHRIFLAASPFLAETLSHRESIRSCRTLGFAGGASAYRRAHF